MNHRNIFRAAFLAVVLALGFGVAQPTTASAATYYGNAVTELYGSTANLKVRPVDSTWSAWKTMRPNSDSYGWPTFIRNTACFFVPAYHVAVNGRTGYGYKGFSTGKEYCFTSGNNHIYLQVETNQCWGWRLAGYPCKVPVPA